MRDGDRAFLLGVMINEITSNKEMIFFNAIRNEISQKDAEIARRYTKRLAKNLQVDLDIDANLQFVNSRSDVLLDVFASHSKWTVDCCDLGFEFASYCENRGGYPLNSTTNKDMADLFEKGLQERAIRVRLNSSFTEELIKAAKNDLVSHEDFIKIARKVFLQIIEFLGQDDNILHQIIVQGDYIEQNKIESYSIGDITNAKVSGLVQGEKNIVISEDSNETEIAQVSKPPVQKSKREVPATKRTDLEDSTTASGIGDLSQRDTTTSTSNEKAIRQQIEKSSDEPTQVTRTTSTSKDKEKKTSREDSTKYNQPEEDPFVGYKKRLISVYEYLADIDLRPNSGRSMIEYYQRIIADILKAVRNADISVNQSIRSKGALISALKEASKEIGIALYLSSQFEEEGIRVTERIEGVRKFYINLNKCQEYIDQALLQFRF